MDTVRNLHDILHSVSFQINFISKQFNDFDLTEWLQLSNDT